MIRVHIPSKFCCVGLRMVKFCHLMRQMLVETSQYPCVISTNPVGHSDKIMKHSKVAFSSITIPIIFISREYPGNSPGWKFSSSSRETCDPVCERHCPVRKRNLVLIIKNVNSWCWQVLLKDIDIFVVVRFPWTSTRCPIHPNPL